MAEAAVEAAAVAGCCGLGPAVSEVKLAAVKLAVAAAAAAAASCSAASEDLRLHEVE